MKKIIAFLIAIVLVLPELLFSQSVGGLYYARLGTPLRIYGTTSTKIMTFEYADSYFTIGTNASSYPIRFFPEGTTAYALEIQDDEVIIPSTKTLTIGGTLAVTGGITQTAGAAGLDFIGAYTNTAIDLSNVTLNHAGSSGPVMIRAGNYTTPVASSDPHQSGMIRLYGSNSSTTDGGGGFYDRGIFVYNLITGNKSAFPIAGLVEVRNVGVEAGPVAIMAAQFIVGLHTSTAKLAATASVTDGMFGSWNKVYSVTGSVAAATSRVAATWLDNQMSGTVSGEEYGIFATTGGTRPDGFIGFETTSSGYDQFIYCDATFNSGAGTMITTDAVPGGNQDARIKVYYNGTQYYIPLYR